MNKYKQMTIGRGMLDTSINDSGIASSVTSSAYFANNLLIEYTPTPTQCTPEPIALFEQRLKQIRYGNK